MSSVEVSFWVSVWVYVDAIDTRMSTFFVHGDAESQTSQALDNVINAFLRMWAEVFGDRVKNYSGALGLSHMTAHLHK